MEMTVKEIQTVAVVGAGNMGAGIAQKYATEGYPVLLVDRDQESVEKGIARIRATLAEGVERKIFRPEAAEAIATRVRPVLDWDELKAADLVVEAVFEDLGVKREVFSRLAAHTRPDCILATNTSSFYVKELSATTPHPERVLGLHYFYHPAKNRLVEVIPAPETTKENVQAAWDAQERIGKTPIWSKDAPGFVVNRFFVPWINEATRLHEEALGDIPTIEQAAIQAFRIGMGPFQLMNVTGIPIGYHAAATLEKQLGPFYGPSGILKAYAESGRQFDFGGDAKEEKFRPIQERLLGITWHIACKLVDEGVGTIEDVDIGARVGLRWAQGPFEMMNRAGMAEVDRIVGAVETFYKLGRPALLQTQVRADVPFPLRLVKSEIENGLATITFNRPDAMNALSPEVMAQFEAQLDTVIADAGVTGIAIAGAGKAFIAGADIRFFVKNMKADTYGHIVGFASHGQQVLEKIEASPKPVVAVVDGLTLGGGLELALACDHILVTEKASLAFPETGIGIYPGLGGTQRTSRRVGIDLTKWLVYSGQFLDAKTAVAIGLADRVVDRGEMRTAVRAAIAEGKKATARQGAARAGLAEAVAGNPLYRGIAQFFRTYSVGAILAGEVPRGDDDLDKLVSKLRSRAPLALVTSEALIDGGGRGPLSAGLEMEMAEMERVFRTADAMEGLTSLGKKRPEFQGA